MRVEEVAWLGDDDDEPRPQTVETPFGHRSARAHRRTVVVAGIGVMWMLAIATFVNGPIDRIGEDAPPDNLAFADDDPVTWTSSLLTAGDVVFVDRTPGESWEHVGIRHADRTRTILDKECERLHVAAAIGLCLGPAANGDDHAYRADVISLANAQLDVVRADSGVSPSRARVSSDGGWASATMIRQQGDDEDEYAELGSLQTIVTIVNLGAGNSTRINRFDHPPTNGPTTWWGVTFGPDNDQIWVTGADDDGPQIYTGSLAERTLTPTRIGASCPSISPDGKTLVVRMAEGGVEGATDLVAIDQQTGEQWRLNEDREVVDQVEWLDNDTILYALPADDFSAEMRTFDVWSLDLRADAEPELFLRYASSPSVIR